MKQAKITKGKAEQIALAKVSHGIVKKRGDRCKRSRNNGLIEWFNE
jgi:hypothetical protein